MRSVSRWKYDLGRAKSGVLVECEAGAAEMLPINIVYQTE